MVVITEALVLYFKWHFIFVTIAMQTVNIGIGDRRSMSLRPF